MKHGLHPRMEPVSYYFFGIIRRSFQNNCHDPSPAAVIYGVSACGTPKRKGSEKVHDKDAVRSFVESCYTLYEQKLYYSALRILRDEGLAEDAVHDVFCALIKRGACFDDPSSEGCRRYLLKAVKNASIDVCSKRRKEADALPPETLELISDGDDGQTVREESADLRAMVSRLPERYRETVECLTVKGMTTAETADALGITEENVRKRLERAKKKLKESAKGWSGV